MMFRVLPVVSLFIVMALSGCEERLKPSVLPGSATVIPSQESWNSTIRFSDSAKVKAIVWSGYIARFNLDMYTILEDSVHIDFYDENQYHTSKLTARRGRVDDRTQDFAAYGNVVVTSDSGTVLKADSLFWKNQTRKIHTPAFVDITSPKEHIMGHGMESDQGLKNYKIFRVTGSAVTNE